MSIFGTAAATATPVLPGRGATLRECLSREMQFASEVERAVAKETVEAKGKAQVETRDAVA